jgi:HEAT repeat protein
MRKLQCVFLVLAVAAPVFAASGLGRIIKEIDDFTHSISPDNWGSFDEDLKTLARSKDPRAYAALVELLTYAETDEPYFTMACDALGILGDKRAIKKLLPFMDPKNDSPKMRDKSAVARACASLGWSPGSDEEKMMYAFARGDWAALAESGLGSLRYFDYAFIESEIVDPDTYKAAASLGAQAIPRLLSSMDDKNDPEPWAYTLALIGDESIGPCVAALSDDRPGLRRGAALALGFMKADSLLPELTKLLVDKDSGVRISAIRALGLIGDSACLPAIVEALSQMGSQASFASIETLASFGDSAIDPIMKQFAAASKVSCFALAYALGLILIKTDSDNLDRVAALSKTAPYAREKNWLSYSLAISGKQAGIDAATELLGRDLDKMLARLDERMLKDEKDEVLLVLLEVKGAAMAGKLVKMGMGNGGMYDLDKGLNYWMLRNGYEIRYSY